MGRVALPFLPLPTNTKLQRKTIDLEPHAHIGMHIRKRRLELGLRQEDVAKQMGVSADSVTYWENGRSNPQIHSMPQIIAFLGYVPVSFENETIGERIKRYRIEHGLSHKKMGLLVGVNAATISTWETGKYIPTKIHLEALEAVWLRNRKSLDEK